MSPPAAQSPTLPPTPTLDETPLGKLASMKIAESPAQPQPDILALPNQLAIAGRAQNTLTLNRLGPLTPEASRPSSPYAPPVNYDGLSWPSKTL